jgi:hypothetical protein
MEGMRLWWGIHRRDEGVVINNETLTGGSLILKIKVEVELRT